jgi:hypothetical protein
MTSSSWESYFNNVHDDVYIPPSQSSWSGLGFLQGVIPPTSTCLLRQGDPRLLMEQPQTTTTSWYSSESHDFTSSLLREYDPSLLTDWHNVDDCANISPSTHSDMQEYSQGQEEGAPLLPELPQAPVTPQREKKSKTRKRQVDSSAKNYIEGTYMDVDVLSGRGGLGNHHPGNQAYLREKERMQSRYLAASKKNKTGISQELVEWVHARGGRFLQKKGKGEKRWYVMDNYAARNKARQALCEINTTEIRATKRAKYSTKKKRNDANNNTEFNCLAHPEFF